MGIGMLIDNPEGSREVYEQILDHLDTALPLGGILHVAGPSPGGGWRVIEVWESSEEAERFVVERFAPALRAAGFEGAPPTPQFWPVQVVEAARGARESVTGGPTEVGAR